jgi:DNA repair photolyase
MPFLWTINPYRGCEFGCQYCYARYTHEFLELRDPRQFETRIFAKQFEPSAFRKELAAIPRDQAIAIGTATDPYQPAEARFHLTRGLLEVLSAERGRRFSLITKSSLIARDASLLAAIGRSNLLYVHITVTTMDTPLARLLEPRAPRPDLRIRALEQLSGRGVSAGVFASPVLPLLTDSIESLTAVAAAAAHAGASHFGGHALFLKPCSRQVFLPFLEQHFPHLVARYRSQFDRGAYLRGAYPQWIAARFEEIRKRYRLNRRPEEYLAPEQLGEPQLELFQIGADAGAALRHNR